MAQTYYNYTYNGTNNFTSPLFDNSLSEIRAYVNTIEVTFTFFDVSNTAIVLDIIPNTGDIVEVLRVTKIDTRAVDYTNGSILREEVLDLDSNQMFYLAQEAIGNTERSLFLFDILDTVNFNGNLSPNDKTIQIAFDTLDNMTLGEGSLYSVDTTNFNNNLTTNEDTVQKAFDVLDNISIGDVKSFNLITDLPLDDTLYKSVYIRGYNVVNDGGGGIFTYDSTKSAVNDGGIVINGWVREYNSEKIDVKFFGAKGNGISTEDDNISLQNTFDYCSLNGKTVFISTGIYFLNTGGFIIDNPAEGFNIIGEGQGSSILRMNYNNISISCLTLSNILFRCDVKDFYIYGDFVLTTNENSHGLVIYDSSYINVENINIYSVNNTGILVYATGDGLKLYKNININNCKVYGNNETENGILLEDMLYSKINNCYVEKVTEFSLELKNQSTHCEISNCIAISCGSGIYLGQDTAVGVSYSNIYNCVIKDCRDSITIGYGSFNTISNILIDNNGTKAVNTIVDLSGDSISNFITNISIFNKELNIEPVRFRTGSLRNTVEFSAIHGTTIGTIAGFDLNVDNNKVTIVKAFESNIEIYDLDTLVRDDSTLLNNEIYDKTFNGKFLKSNSSGYYNIVKNRVSYAKSSIQNFVFEDTSPVYLSLLNEDSTGSSGLIIGDTVSPINSSFLYDITGAYWQLKTGGSNDYRFYSSVFRPVDDNIKNLGSAANRWATIYAGNATINTSDERTKTKLLEIDDKEKLVAIDLKKELKKFKFLKSVEEKGEDNSRIHFGVGAQSVVEVFKKHNLDATRYSLLCYDEWKEELDKDGVVIKEKGNIYGIRYEELLAFIIAAM